MGLSEHAETSPRARAFTQSLSGTGPCLGVSTTLQAMEAQETFVANVKRRSIVRLFAERAYSSGSSQQQRHGMPLVAAGAGV